MNQHEESGQDEKLRQLFAEGAATRDAGFTDTVMHRIAHRRRLRSLVIALVAVGPGIGIMLATPFGDYLSGFLSSSPSWLVQQPVMGALLIIVIASVLSLVLQDD